VTEVVEHFPRKHERPEFNPHYHQKKTKQNKKKPRRNIYSLNAEKDKGFH
jgi:hypothetical protein